MRKPLVEQIKEAKRFYAIKVGNDRYSIYRVYKGQLDVLWPVDSEKHGKSKDMKTVHGMVYTSLKSKPAYHVHTDMLVYTLKSLQRHSPEATLEILEGMSTTPYYWEEEVKERQQKES